MKKLVAYVIFMVLAASVVLIGAAGAAVEGDAAFSIDMRARADMNGTGTWEIKYTPDVSGTYDVAVFAEAGCRLDRAIVKSGNAILSGGSDFGATFSAKLEADREYTILLEGAGECTVEVMRRAPGRSAAQPTHITGGKATGQIIREGSAGWFVFTGSSRPTTVYIHPIGGADLSLDAQIYVLGGTLAASGVSLPGGACAVYLQAVSGVRYYLRAASPDGGRGQYEVSVVESGDAAPQSLEIFTGALSMRTGDMRGIRAKTLPDGSAGDLIWASSDDSVAQVDGSGIVTAVGEGEAVISVYAFGGLQRDVSVSVEAVKPQDIGYYDVAVGIRVGDTVKPELTVYPSTAADAAFEYTSENPEVAEITEEGVVTAVSEGVATVHARYGELDAELIVVVGAAPARYRALLIGEQMYDAGVNNVRIGSVNTVYNLESLLGTAEFDTGVGIETRVELDLTAQETLDTIAETFADAAEGDVSLLYISCHGYFRDGMSLLQFCDGSELAACDLERALRSVPGTIVLLVDCCDSGGFIGTYDELSDLTGGIVSAFAGENAPFSGTKYKVLASASLGQDSYRLGYGEEENDIATAFARALCDGLGWNMDGQRRGSLSADADYDGRITLWEAYQYTARRVGWYLSMADGGTGAYRQNVKVYPEGDMFTLFER